MIGIRCSECEAPRDWQDKLRDCGCRGDETGQTVIECHFHKVVGERDKLRKQLEIAVYALVFYSTPRHMGCGPSGSHDDPTWCTDSCGDYGKRARKAIEALNGS